MLNARIRLYDKEIKTRIKYEAILDVETRKYDFYKVINGDLSKKRLVKRGVSSKQILASKKNFSGMVCC